MPTARGAAGRRAAGRVRDPAVGRDRRSGRDRRRPRRSSVDRRDRRHTWAQVPARPAARRCRRRRSAAQSRSPGRCGPRRTPPRSTRCARRRRGRPSGARLCSQARSRSSGAPRRRSRPRSGAAARRGPPAGELRHRRGRRERRQPAPRPERPRDPQGEVVLCDFGGTLDGYCSDITRCVSTRQRRRPRSATPTTCSSRHRPRRWRPPSWARRARTSTPRARSIIADAGYGPQFIHRTGHGIGVEAHEDPYIVAGNEQRLAPGHAFSIEPGIYVPGRFGLRLEDIVVATEEGPDADEPRRSRARRRRRLTGTRRRPTPPRRVEYDVSSMCSAAVSSSASDPVAVHAVGLLTAADRHMNALHGRGARPESVSKVGEEDSRPTATRSCCAVAGP